MRKLSSIYNLHSLACKSWFRDLFDAYFGNVSVFMLTVVFWESSETNCIYAPLL